MHNSSRTPERLSIPGVLVLENREQEATPLINLCELSFKITTFTKKIITTGKTNIINQFNQFKDVIPNGSVTFLDICLEQDPNIHSGREVAQHIRRVRPDMPIIIYSIRADIATCVNILEEDQADYVIDKELIRNDRMSVRDFNRNVAEAIKRHKEKFSPTILIKPNSIDEIESVEDWLIFELMSRIGRAEISLLIHKCINNAKIAKLDYMSPGFSGAHVIRASVERIDQPMVEVVLKLSRNKESLEKDLKHVTDLGASYSGRLVPHIRDEGIQGGLSGWHAYAMEKVPGVPLSRLLHTLQDSMFIDRVLAELDEFYKSQTITDCDPLEVDISDDSEIAAVIVQIQNIKPLLELHQPDDAISVDEMINCYINDSLPNKTNEDIYKILGQLPGVRQHGDIHADNIFLDIKNESQIFICLIDWARYGLYPLGSDLARFESQLRLRAFDSYDCSDYALSNINNWEQIDNTLQQDISTLAINENVLNCQPWGKYFTEIRRLAQRQINRCNSTQYSSQLNWWYYYCLFRNYLKGIGYGHLPAAKRVWAYRSAMRLGKILAEKL